jgi:hypothetical protein
MRKLVYIFATLLTLSPSLAYAYDPGDIIIKECQGGNGGSCRPPIALGYVVF